MRTGSAIISVRGSITCPAVRSPNPNTRWSICSSSSSMTPASWLAVTSIFSSSSEWTSELPLGGFKPSSRTTQRPVLFRTVMNGQKTRMKISVGRPTMSAVRSACWRATVFGASSPRTMCSAVMKAKPSATEMVCEVAARRESGSRASPGSMIDDTAGSPIHPRPRLVIVIANWVAAM